MYHQNNEQIVNSLKVTWNFPHEINPIEALGHNHIQEKFISIFTEINNLFYTELKKHSFSNEFAIKILFRLIKQLKNLSIFEEKRKFIQFLSFSLKTNMYYNQKINNASSMSVRRYYYQLDINKYRESYEKNINSWDTVYKSTEFSGVNEQLINLSNFVLENIERKIVFWEDIVLPFKLSDDEKYQFIMFYKFIEYLQRMLFIESDHKPYAIYCLLRSVIAD